MAWHSGLAAAAGFAAALTLAACGRGDPEPVADAPLSTSDQLVVLRAAQTNLAAAVEEIGEASVTTGETLARLGEQVEALTATMAAMANAQQANQAALTTAIANARASGGGTTDAAVQALVQRINDLAAAQAAITELVIQTGEGDPAVAAAIADLTARQAGLEADVARLQADAADGVAAALAAIAGQLATLQAAVGGSAPAAPAPAIVTTPDAAPAGAPAATAGATPPNLAAIEPANGPVRPPPTTSVFPPVVFPTAAPAGGGDLTANPTTVAVNIDSTTLTFDTAEFTIETGKAYRWVVTSDGGQVFVLEAVELFQNVWVDRVSIGGADIIAVPRAGLEFETGAEVIIGFVPIRPGSYPFSVKVQVGPSLVDIGLEGTFVVN